MSATSPLASDSRTDGTLSAITLTQTVGWTKRSVPTIPHSDFARWWARFALPTVRILRKRGCHRAQPIQLHLHAVAGIKPHRLHETPGEHDLPGMQPFAFLGEMVGEPGQRVVGMAKHVGAGAAAGFIAVDDGAAGDLEQVGRLVARNRLAEHAAGGEEVISDERRRAHRLPFD